MHELSIAVGLIEQVEALLDENQAALATRVCVRIGSLSGVEPEALRMAFPVAAEDGRVAADALEIECVPAKARCGACGRSYEPAFPFLACEHCGDADVEVLEGRDMTLISVEMKGSTED